jgi:hypothetical protein
MADGYSQQHSGWDIRPAYSAPLDTPAPLEYGMGYQSMPAGSVTWVCSPSHVHQQNCFALHRVTGLIFAGQSIYDSPQYGCASGSQIPGTTMPPTLAESQVSNPLEQDRFNTPVWPNPKGGSHTHPKSPGTGKSSPADYSEKRRQQNRNSQIAFRQRNKMTLKLLQEELSQSLLTNAALYGTMEELLEKTENLKRSIEDVLASRLRRSNRDFFGSPGSSSCLTVNYDGIGG